MLGEGQPENGIVLGDAGCVIDFLGLWKVIRSQGLGEDAPSQFSLPPSRLIKIAFLMAPSIISLPFLHSCRLKL